jgi:hypothetical protein
VKEVASGRADVAIALRAPAAVAGTVVTRSGRPASAFTLALARAPAAGDSDGKRFRQSDEGALPPVPVHDPGGAFSVEGLEAGTYQLKVSTPQGEAATERLEVAAGERRGGLRIVLQPGARVTGKVVAAGGGAIAGARVSARVAGRNLEAATGADGTFDLAGLSAGDELHVDIRSLDAPTLVPEYRRIVVPASGGTVDLGVIAVLAVEGPWFERVGEGVGPGLAVSAAAPGIVETVRPGTGAARAGILPGDAVLSVDGREVAGLGPGAIMFLLQGPAHSTATLKVQTPGTPPRLVSAPREPSR